MFHSKQAIFDILQIQVVIACEKGQLNINARTNDRPRPFAVPLIALQNVPFAVPAQHRPNGARQPAHRSCNTSAFLMRCTDTEGALRRRSPMS